MKSFFLIFLPYLFLIIPLVGSGAESGAKFYIERGGDQTTGNNDCEDNYKNLSSEVRSKCSNKCDGSPNAEKELIECVREVCQDQCQEHINSHLNACEGTQYNNPCNSLCNGDPPIFEPDNNQLKQVQNNCAQANREQIKQNLVEQCQHRLRELSQGRGKLICPGGNTHNPNCNTFCKNQANKIANNSQCLNNDKITSHLGFQNCQNQLTEQISSTGPQTPEALAQTKGFSFQKCALGDHCEYQLQQYFHTGLTNCQQFNKQAKTCCSEPLKCLSKEGNQALNQGQNNISQQDSISHSCAKLQQSLNQAGQVSQKMADTCQKMAKNCTQACSQVIASHIQKPFLDTCAFDLTTETEYNPAQHTCAKNMILKYSTQYQQKVIPLLSSCQAEDQKSQSLAQNAKELLKSALSAQQCQQQASASMAIDTPPTPSAENPAQNNTMPHSPSAMGAVNSGFNTKTANTKNNPDFSREGGGIASANKVRKGGITPSNLSSTGGEIGGRGPSSLKKRKNSRQKHKGGWLSRATNTLISGGGGGAYQKGLSSGRGKKGFSALLGNKSDNERDSNKKGVFANQKKGLNNSTLQATSRTNNPYLKDLPRGVANRHHKEAFGSRFDNIFNRISNRIAIMCQQKKLINCHYTMLPHKN